MVEYLKTQKLKDNIIKAADNSPNLKNYLYKLADEKKYSKGRLLVFNNHFKCQLEKFIMHKINKFTSDDEINKIFMDKVFRHYGLEISLDELQITEDLDTFDFDCVDLEGTYEFILRTKDLEYVETINKTPRIEFLMNKFKPLNVVASAFDLFSLVDFTQQVSMPQRLFDYLYENHNLRVEGFASPFNSKLIEKGQCFYYSLFPSDLKLGSSGNFFSPEKIHVDKVWFINPPFLDEFLNTYFHKYIKDVILIKKIKFFALLPPSGNFEISKLLSNTHDEIILKDYTLVRANGQSFIPQFESSFWYPRTEKIDINKIRILFKEEHHKSFKRPIKVISERPKPSVKTKSKSTKKK